MGLGNWSSLMQGAKNSPLASVQGDFLCDSGVSESLWSPWLGFEAVPVAEPPDSSADICFPSLDIMCLFSIRESLCHRNLGLIYQHELRPITPLKCSASAELQHQVLPQKAPSWQQTPGKRDRGVYCVPNVPPSWEHRGC